MTRKEQQDMDRKLKVLKYADMIKNISKACRYFGVEVDPKIKQLSSKNKL